MSSGASHEGDVPVPDSVRELASELASARDLAFALARDRDHGSALARARDRNREYELARALARELDHANTLAVELRRARGLDPARVREVSFTLARAHARARALDLPRIRVLDRARALVRDLDRHLDRASTLVGDLAHSLACDSERTPREPMLLAGRLLAVAAWMLPAGDRHRYREEFWSELAEIASAGGCRRAQLGYAIRQVKSASWSLRAELRAPQRRGALP